MISESSAKSPSPSFGRWAVASFQNLPCWVQSLVEVPLRDMLVGRQLGFEPGAGRFETYSRNQSGVLVVDSMVLSHVARVRILPPEPN